MYWAPKDQLEWNSSPDFSAQPHSEKCHIFCQFALMDKTIFARGMGWCGELRHGKGVENQFALRHCGSLFLPNTWFIFHSSDWQARWEDFLFWHLHLSNLAEALTQSDSFYESFPFLNHCEISIFPTRSLRLNQTEKTRAIWRKYQRQADALWCFIQCCLPLELCISTGYW